MLATNAQDVAESTLDAVLGSGYGIFSGEDVTWAQLRFTPARARWVASEQWHPLQRTRFDADGSFILELPYSDPRELTMDILRHGADVHVLAPDALRNAVVDALDAAHSRYLPQTLDANAATPGGSTRSRAPATRRAARRARRAL
jgi:predicted DNA-binding transcriptional regulator YafY